jgi:TolA-binding protein
MHLKKAGIITCLFLSALSLQGQHQWFSNTEQIEAYNHAINLRPDQAREVLHDKVDPISIYILNLNEALELLVLEDENLFEEYENKYIARIEQLKEGVPTASSLYTQAELRIQWAFIYLKFGHELDAAWNIRLANQLVQECKKKFPNFSLIKKPSGLLQIMIGTVPEKFQWILRLLNMNGSVEEGFQELNYVITIHTAQRFETKLLYHLIQGFMLQQPDVAFKGIEELLMESPTNKLLLFLGTTIAIKNADSETALSLLSRLDQQTEGLTLPYAYYLKGEVYLHRGNYSLSINAYQQFLEKYKGVNFIKDATYKIGVCYWLLLDKTKADLYFEKAKREGKEASEADKYAARSLAEKGYPNVKLSKVRYYTDGGYYNEARALIKTIQEKDLITLKEKVEYTYRLARLHHKLLITEEAKKNYLATISLSGNNNWYFAPNACLQLGYLFQEENNLTEAKKHFEKALSYKRHEYKNSIDSKAKSALAQLSRKSK